MVPWIQVYSTILTNPKTYALAGRLGLKKNYEAVGIMVSLWSWVAMNAPDGDITKFPAQALARAVDWTKCSPDKFLTGLIDVRLIDKTADGRLVIHDWEEYAVLLMESIEVQKEKTNARVKRYRENQKARRSASENAERNVTGNVNSNVTGNVNSNVTGNVNSNVTGNVNSNVTGNVNSNVTATLCNGSTRPDQTRPDQTRPISSSTTTTTAGVSSVSSSSKSEAVRHFLEQVNPGLSESGQEELSAFEGELSAEMVIRAIDIALDAGAKDKLAYTRAVLNTWRSEGVHTLEDINRREAGRKGATTAAPPGAEAFQASTERLKRFRDSLKGSDGPA